MARACWLIAFATVLGATGVTPPANATTTAATTGESLSAVSCVSAKFCAAVGVSRVEGKAPSGLVSLIWNGVKWRRVAMKMPSGALPGIELQSVSCRSAAYCVAVGSAATVSGGDAFAQTWNGRTWTLALLPKPPAALNGVSCAAVRACVAGGWRETPDGNQLPVVETLAGAKWTIRRGALPRGAPGANVGAVSCPAITYCVLAGQHDIPGDYIPLFESWNGKAFTQMKAPAPRLPMLSAADVSCVSMRSCVAVDNLFDDPFDFTSFAQVWNGRTWSSLADPWPKTIAEDSLNADSCRGTMCMAVGQFDSAGLPGAVVFNGRKWTMTTKFPSPPGGDVSSLRGVSCVSATLCVAVGAVGPSSGLVAAALTGVWNGRSWKLVAAP